MNKIETNKNYLNLLTDMEEKYEEDVLYDDIYMKMTKYR